MSAAGIGAPSAWDCSASVLGTGFTAATAGTVSCTHTPTPAAPLSAGTYLDVIEVRVLVGPTAAPVSDPSAANTITNVATVTGVTDTTPSSSSTATPIRRVAVLAVDKRHDGTTEPWRVGSRQRWEIVVSNTGPSPEHGPVVVTDTLPTGLSLVSADGPGWSCASVGQSITCTHGRPVGLPSTAGLLAAGSALPPITVTVDVTAAAAPLLAPAINTVSNSATVRGVTDTTPRDDVDQVRVEPVADLSIAKSHSGSQLVGTDATFTLQVRNAGPSVAAAPVTVVDTLPAGLSFVSADGPDWSCAAVGQVVTCTSPTDVAALGALPPITVVAAIGPAAEPV